MDRRACKALLYRIYALPGEAARREALYDAAATSGVLLHFANEGLTLASERDRERIEATLAFAGYGEP